MSPSSCPPQIPSSLLKNAGCLVGRGFNRGISDISRRGLPRLLRPGDFDREAPEAPTIPRVCLVRITCQGMTFAPFASRWVASGSHAVNERAQAPTLLPQAVAEAAWPERHRAPRPISAIHRTLVPIASFRCRLLRLRVLQHPLEIHHHHGFVADNPPIVARRQQRDITRLAIELRAVIHAHAQHARNVVLKMRRLAALRFRHRLYGRRPSPSRLEDGPADGRTAYSNQFHASLRKLAHLIRLPKTLYLCLCHS